MEILDHLAAKKDLILAAYAAAPGKEPEGGKASGPVSSAALAANAFGFFVGPGPQEPAALLPPLPGCGSFAWPASRVRLECEVRFPWVGGRHPCLDAMIDLADAIIGIESKRFEPFRPRKPAELSSAYNRPVWGQRMRGTEALRDAIRAGELRFEHLDAVQLVKHAFALRTEAERQGKQGVLYYVYAEPDMLRDPGATESKPLPRSIIAKHRAEIARFAQAVADDELGFRSIAWRDLLASWGASDNAALQHHADRLTAQFHP